MTKEMRFVAREAVGLDAAARIAELEEALRPFGEFGAAYAETSGPDGAGYTALLRLEWTGGVAQIRSDALYAAAQVLGFPISQSRMWKESPDRVEDGRAMPGEGDDIQAWIERVNASIRAFWARVEPALASLTDEDLRTVARLGREQGLAMNQIGLWVRGWVPALADEVRGCIPIGDASYRRALEALDLYDAYLRPEPTPKTMLSQEVPASTPGQPPVALQVDYLSGSGEFEICVSQGDRIESERFKAGHTPRFGIDAADQAEALRIAERLADGLDSSPALPDRSTSKQRRRAS